MDIRDQKELTRIIKRMDYGHIGGRVDGRRKKLGKMGK
jgi:hypothetical protein